MARSCSPKTLHSVKLNEQQHECKMVYLMDRSVTSSAHLELSIQARLIASPASVSNTDRDEMISNPFSQSRQLYFDKGINVAHCGHVVRDKRFQLGIYIDLEGLVAIDTLVERRKLVC